MTSSTRSGSKVSRVGITVLATVGLVGLQVATAFADEVTSEDTVLHGKITGVSGAGITFEPAYGTGALTMKWENIQDLKSDGPFQILYGDDQETDQPLQGLASDGMLLIGESAATAIPVDVTTIFVGIPIGPEGPSFVDRMRSSWRYWDGHFDLGFNLQQSTTDTTGLVIGLHTERTKMPTHFSIGADYRYSTQTSPDNFVTINTGTGTPTRVVNTGGKKIIEDQLFGYVREEYYFQPRFYGFASGDGTYDAIQKLSIRAIPKLGVGYVFYEEQLDETTRNFFQGEVGGGWVYENFFKSTHTPNNQYFTIVFGLRAGYYLPYGAHWDFKLDYLPAVDDFSNYLVRGETGVTVPIISVVAGKFSLIDVYDSTPAADTDRNSLYLTIGLSVVW